MIGGIEKSVVHPKLELQRLEQPNSWGVCHQGSCKQLAGFLLYQPKVNRKNGLVWHVIDAYCTNHAKKFEQLYKGKIE